MRLRRLWWWSAYTPALMNLAGKQNLFLIFCTSKRQISMIRGQGCARVTRWLDYFWLFGHLQQWKLAQWRHWFNKICLAFCQIRNKPSKICQILENCCQSGKILPNLATLQSSAILNIFKSGFIRNNEKSNFDFPD